MYHDLSLIAQVFSSGESLIHFLLRMSRTHVSEYQGNQHGTKQTNHDRQQRRLTSHVGRKQSCTVKLELPENDDNNNNDKRGEREKGDREGI